MAAIFLTAEWRKLAMANYAIDPRVLGPFVPRGTEIDAWKGTCYVSLVGFMFLNTRVMGWRIPFHTNFEEVNLRFYVRCKEREVWKRGVVFLREIVPKRMLTWVANTLYDENYQTMPMSHSWKTAGDVSEIEYRWKKSSWNRLKIMADRRPVSLGEGSEEEFITEHFWGYTRVSDRRTSEYGVEHPRWEVYPMQSCEVDVDFADVYGRPFGFLSREKPRSVFLAEGSAIKVTKGRDV